MEADFTEDFDSSGASNGLTLSDSFLSMSLIINGQSIPDDENEKLLSSNEFIEFTFEFENQQKTAAIKLIEK